MTRHEATNLPETGAIVDFRYRQKEKSGAGDTQLAEPMPCLIWNVRAIETLQLVAVLPIMAGATGARVTIDQAECAALGLADNSEVVFEEANVFLWCGPDLVPQPDGSLIRPQRASRKLIAAIAAAMAGLECRTVIRP